MHRAIPGLRVVDLSEGVAGAYCTKLLSDLGADVLKVERPSGDALRQMGPFPGDASDIERGGMFLHLSAGKRSCVIDFEAADLEESLFTLAVDADVIVESLPTSEREQLAGLWQRLQETNPRIVVTSVTPYGLTGPYRDYPSHEITDWALGGYMYFCGDPARAPLMVPGHQAAFHAGMQAALGTLAAIRSATWTGKGQSVDVSHWESMLSAHAWLSEMWTHCGAVMRRRGTDFVECQDGLAYIIRAIFCNPSLFLLIDRPDLADDPRWSNVDGWFANTDELWEIVEEWTRRHSKHELVSLAQELRMAATPVNTVEDLVQSPQLKSREWFVEQSDERRGPTRLPGAPYKFSDSDTNPQSAAPLLGQDTAQALAGTPWAAERMPSRTGVADSSMGPLTGVKVVELTSNWAGPLAGRVLADLGAEVIKVEIASRPAARVHYYVGNEPGKYHYNRAGYFNHLNRNKMGISLDVSKPHGLAVFRKLLQWADVFIENNSPRVVRNLGVDFAAVHELNPGLIMVSLSGFGHTGPHSEYVAFGTNIEASSGLTSVIGYGRGENYRTGSFYADPIAGSHGAIAAIAALLQRDRTGLGQHIDLSLQEASAGFLSEFLMDNLLNGRVAEPQGNRGPAAAPQGCYPTAGDDMWVTLAVQNEEEWNRFCSAIERPDWLRDPRFATKELRHQNHDDLDLAISEWTRTQDHREAADILLKAGIAAAPVLTNWEILVDPHIAARGFYVPVPHPQAGTLPYPGFPWKFSATPGTVRRGAPCFAQDNGSVFRDILQLTESEISMLSSQGMTDTIPQTPILRGTL